MNALQEKYLAEVGHRLHRAGFEAGPEYNLLTADGLSGDYRVLAEFGNVVLAGYERESCYGVEFITWERIQNGTGLWQGNYYENDYAAAKQNFATHSGLLSPALLFTPEQLAVIFDAVQNMTAEGFVSNPKQEKLLEQVMEQIEEVVPEVIDLANELTQYPKQHELGGMEQIYSNPIK
ncbi:MAG: hypothetical protein HFF62_13895 [Oscillospiraceae bacterium]|nr:hypothetical protein [Oscillospiraceae bacterium]